MKSKKSKSKSIFKRDLSSFINMWPSFLTWLGQMISKPRSNSTIKKILSILFGISLIASTYLLTIPFLSHKIDLKLNDVAQYEIKIKSTIRYIDEEETLKYKKEAYEKEKYVFDHNLEVRNKIHEHIREEINLLSKFSPEEARKEFSWLRSNRFSAIAANKFLSYPNKDKLIAWAINYSLILFDSYGVLVESLPLKIKQGLKKTVAKVHIINDPDERKDILWNHYRVINKYDIFSPYYLSRLKNLPTEDMEQQFSSDIRDVIIIWVLGLYKKNPTLRYNDFITNKLKKEAYESVVPITRTLKKGLTIARAGEVIDIDKLKSIRILNTHKNNLNLRFILGVFVVMSLFSFATSFIIYRFSDFKFRDFSSHLILHSLLLTFFIISFVISRLEIIDQQELPSTLFIPLGFLPTMLGLMFGPIVTYVISIYASVYLYLLSGYDAGSLILALISISAGIYAATSMQHRTKFLKSAFLLSISLIGSQIGMDLLLSQTNGLIEKVLLCFANAFVSMFLTMIFLPIYETVFNLGTKFRLFELADFNHPLLKKMATEAPSTYTHSLMVANMSERAVHAIGGNSLLTRVGSLYHDIGKLLNPLIYSENKHLVESHAQFRKMGPYKSAQTIIAHVTDGIRMAREHRLPSKVISFIAEHHGTTTIQYFYHKELEEYAQKSVTKKHAISRKKEDFQYPGPKPKTKETAIVMIADSVEAASRSLDEYSRESFEALIDNIIKNKISENQLNECSLTLGDIQKAKEVFIDILLSSHHLRPKYPDMQDTENLQDQVSKKKSNKNLRQFRRSKI